MPIHRRLLGIAKFAVLVGRMRVASLLQSYLMGTGSGRLPAVRGVAKSLPSPLGPDISLRRSDLAAALSAAEIWLARPGARAELSFLEELAFPAKLANAGYRSLKLLLSASSFLRVLVRGISAKETNQAGPAAFVPALLSFMEKPLEVLVIGQGRGRAEALAEQLQAHAPWHRVTAEFPSHIRSADLVIVAMEQGGIWEQSCLAALRFNLAIFAGEGLAGFSASSGNAVSSASDGQRPAKSSRAAA